MSATTLRERAAGSELSSAWKSRLQPLRSASRRDRARDADSAPCGWRRRDPRPISVDHRLDVGHVRGSAGWSMVNRGDAWRSILPRQRSRASHNRPTDSRLRADAVDMGANGCRPVRVGAAQAELHARGDVGGAPVGGTVCDGRRDCARKIPDRVSFPSPDMPFVEMGVDVGLKSGRTMRPDITTSGVSPKSAVAVGAIGTMTPPSTKACRRGETVKVEWRDGLRQHAARDARPLQHARSGKGKGEGAAALANVSCRLLEIPRTLHFGRSSRPTPLFTNCSV